MPPKRKTKEISKSDRETTHKATESATTPPHASDCTVCIKLSPVQIQQLEIIAEVINDDTPEEYAKKIINKHIADRMYLIRGK
jgi:hypothetical protein